MRNAKNAKDAEYPKGPDNANNANDAEKSKITEGSPLLTPASLNTKVLLNLHSVTAG